MQTRLPVLALSKPLRLSKSVSWSLVLVFVLLALVAPVLPDYDNYQAMYESGGGHLAVIGRDFGFVLLIKTLESTLSYNQFRFFLITVSAIMTLLALRNLQGASSLRLSMSLVVALMPLIILKYGIQIREGVALCLWIFVVLGSSKRMHPILFVALAILSMSMHAATAPLWLVLAFAYYFHPSWPRTALLLSISVYASFIYLVADVARLEEDLFVGLSQESVNPDVFTVLYWFFYPGIFLLSLLQREIIIQHRSFPSLQLRTFGFLVYVTMIGFLIGLFIQIWLLDLTLLQKGLIADIMRIAGLILAFYCIFLAISGKNKKGIILALFLSADTARIILAA